MKSESFYTETAQEIGRERADRPTPAIAVLPASRRCTLTDVHRTFRRWLGEDYDLAAANATLAAAAVEQLTGDPLWLLIISGPGNAKTETVQSLRGAGALVTSTIGSEGALLSVTSRREKARDATGGLLRRIGDRGILIVRMRGGPSAAR